jgi:broad specificity phosphatase PhoE
MPNFGKRAARQALREMPGVPDVVTLWDLAETEHPAWIAEGCGDVTFAEYQQRIHAARQEFERHGHRVVLVSATVREVLDALADCDLPNTPDGRAAAIAFLQARRAL